MEQENKGLGASADADRAAGLRPQPPAASSRSSIPSAGDWQPWISKGKRYGELPVERGVLVDVRYRDGGVGLSLPAGKDTGPSYRDAETRFWVQERHHSDIMFWRPAQAIDARSGQTACGLDPKGESAVGEADAPEGDRP